METSPEANRPVFIDHLRRGACYKVNFTLFLLIILTKKLANFKKIEKNCQNFDKIERMDKKIEKKL